MKVIETLSDRIIDEQKAEMDYWELALMFKDTDKALADTFAKVAESEHGHVNAFHDQVVRLIKEKESKGEKVPEGMRLLYDREHKRQIEMAVKIKSMSALYRGN